MAGKPHAHTGPWALCPPCGLNVRNKTALNMNNRTDQEKAHLACNREKKRLRKMKGILFFFFFLLACINMKQTELRGHATPERV